MIPVGLNLNNKHVLIVGGGKVALRKAKLFLSHKAMVTIVSPSFLDEILNLDVQCIVDCYSKANLKGKFLVYAATDDKDVNRQIVEDCNGLNILCGSATKNENVSFNSMAFQDTNIGMIALSTHQKMPFSKPLLNELVETLETHTVQLNLLSKIRTYLVREKQMNPQILEKLYSVSEATLTFICDSLMANQGYIFVYHQSDYSQRYNFDIFPSIVVSLEEFKELQEVLFEFVPYQVVPLLLSDGYIYQKLKKMSRFEVLSPLMTTIDDIKEVIGGLRCNGKRNIWLMHPRSQTLLLEEIKSCVPNEDVVQTFDEPLVFEENSSYHVVVLLMSEGKHYHELIDKLPRHVSSSHILPLEKVIKTMIYRRLYRFEMANKDDLESVYQLLNERMDWMVKKGIKQWDKDHYWNVYPKSYYENQVDLNQLYVLRKNNQVVGSIILYEQDERWDDSPQVSSYYLHQFMTTTKEKGLGGIILGEVEQLARKKQKEVLRLDCIANNAFLNDYYENLDFKFVGVCVEGIYVGHKREKRLIKE